MSDILLHFKSHNGIGSELDAVEECLKEALASEVRLIPDVGVYLLGSGGKRIRPLMHLLACSAAGYRGNDHIETAAAIELIHTATLLHDDVVDQAKIRRGKAAAHQVWDNPTSVLVGDFLFAKSFVLMLRAANARLMRIVADVCTQMAEGEALQLILNHAPRAGREDYLEVIRNKTAILFGAACRLGAVLADANSEREEALFAFGDALGMAFQIADDALDFRADPSRLGKAVGKDLEEGKMTLPLLSALDSASASEREEMLALVAGFSKRHEVPSLDELARVTAFVERGEGVDKALALAETYVQAAKRALAPFDDSDAIKTMHALADFVISRDH